MTLQNKTGAAQALQQDIRTSVNNWLLPAYPVTSPLQFTKQQLTDLIDALLRRL